MSYTPVNGLEINGNFVTAGTYTPVNGLEINGDFSGDTPSPVYRRALLIDNGHIRQILDSETGTGRKPVKTLGGEFLIVVGTSLKTLGADETLLI